MENHIKVPESLLMYLQNPAIKVAVDRLLEEKKIPPDLDWQAAADYQDAFFSAYRVQRDYAIMLFKLMNEVCLEAARNKGMTQILPLNGWVNSERPSPKTIWDDGLYCYLRAPAEKEYSVGFCLAENGVSGKLYASMWTDLEKESLDDLSGWELDSDETWWKLADDFAPDLTLQRNLLLVGHSQFSLSMG